MLNLRRALLALSAMLFLGTLASAWQLSRKLWPQVRMVTVARMVPPGTLLKPGDLTVHMIAAGDLLPGAITDTRAAEGRYATHELFPGEQLLGVLVGPAPVHPGRLILTLSGQQVVRPSSLPPATLVTLLGIPPGGAPALIGVHVPAYPTANGVRLEVTPPLALRAVDALRNGPVYLLQETS